jgi:hypothetical protein
MRSIPETTERQKQAVRIVEVVTELPRLRTGLGDLRLSLTFRGTQCCPEGDDLMGRIG